MNQRESLADWISEAHHVVWFTGAGISTDSGLPDFRGPDGVWTRRDRGLPPPPSKTAPGGALPNRTHYVLVELERRGKAAFLISQNVDGLHLDSGFPPDKVAELHGNKNLMICDDCERVRTVAEIGWDRRRWGPGYRKEEQVPGQPSCSSCGGRLYSTVVNFGDSLPVKDLELSYQHAEASDLFVVLGSSLVVSPAADLPGVAREAGAKLVICNLGETPYDHNCDLHFSENVGDLMESVLQQIS